MNQVHELHQVHFFTNNTDTTPSPLFIQSLLGKLSGFGLMPTIGQELNAATGEKRQFVVMIRSDEKLRIEFISSEIVIFGEGLDIAEFYGYVREIFNQLKDIFSTKKSNRLSILNTRIFTGSEVELEQLYKSLFTYKQVNPFEWDNRIVERKTLPKSQESINSISNVKRCEVSVNNLNSSRPMEAVVFDVDSNTIHQNKNDRFDMMNCLDVLDELYLNNQNIIESMNRYTA